MCYSINDYGDGVASHNGSENNATGPFVAMNTGSGYGLHLLLNVEDYEAMAGPQKTVGVKVGSRAKSKYTLILQRRFRC